jgi:S1-C subfamily serine protease
MKRAPLYSSKRLQVPPPETASGRSPAPQAPSPAEGAEAPAAAPAPEDAAAAPRVWRRGRWTWGAAGVLAGALAAAGLAALVERPAQQLTQNDIDRAVMHTLSTQVLPSASARAAEAIRPSVVRVIGLTSEKDDDTKPGDRDVGTGVVIIDRGVILTSLHVVSGAKRLKVVFADGLETDASVISIQPENDLAVLQARRVPDDLVAATLRSTGDLKPGDHVTAVGFPFGIGPSVSSGVVSGLKREFRAPSGDKVLSNLIQFDAAANPGSSGGPLVTDDGAVVGIVAAILNPTQQRFFVGIGFAVPIENAAAGAGLPPF